MSSRSGTSVSRRRFLAIGLGGTAALAAGAGAVRWFRSGYEALLAPDDLPLALSRKELAIVRAFVEAVLPATDGTPSGLALGVPMRIDEELWSAPPATRRDMRNGLQLFEHATILHGFRHRFTALDPALRLAYVDELLGGGPGALQQVAVALKQMAHLFHYAREATWPGIGYDGPWVRDARPPESSVAYAAARREAIARDAAGRAAQAPPAGDTGARRTRVRGGA